jgi:hypothetical protein
VIEFDFRGGHVGTYWLVLERADASVCLQHPKFDVDLRIAADIGQLYRVWLGRIPARAAVAESSVRLPGGAERRPGRAHWFAWSPMAPAVRETAQAR